jgi:multiple sugar transport system ATP-binding protein
MVAGLEMPTSGKILIGGRDVTRLPPKDRDIAMVFQNYALYPHMTVKENLSFALKLRGIPKEEIASRVESAAAVLGLEPYMKRLPKALSGGQRQRVALGRAIVRNPSVFLFDEPLSNLDAKMRVEMRSEIIRLHRRLGATMIYVTHDQTEAMTMGTRIAVMNGGRIQQVAPPMEVYEKPSNTFVASFIGTPPMNLFPAGMLDLGRVTGVRPENMRLELLADGVNADEAELSGKGFSATVDLVEPLGAETLIHCITDRRNVHVTVRLSGDAARSIACVSAGCRVLVRPNMSKAVKFNP